MNHPILIISKQIDISTKDVIEWLNFFTVNWIRINQEKINNFQKSSEI